MVLHILSFKAWTVSKSPSTTLSRQPFPTLQSWPNTCINHPVTEMGAQRAPNPLSLLDGHTSTFPPFFERGVPCNRVSADGRGVGMMGTISMAGLSTVPRWELPRSLLPLSGLMQTNTTALKCSHGRQWSCKIKEAWRPKSPLAGRPSASQEGSLIRARNKY